MHGTPSGMLMVEDKHTHTHAQIYPYTHAGTRDVISALCPARLRRRSPARSVTRHNRSNRQHVRIIRATSAVKSKHPETERGTVTPRDNNAYVYKL